MGFPVIFPFNQSIETPPEPRFSCLRYGHGPHVLRFSRFPEGDHPLENAHHGLILGQARTPTLLILLSSNMATENGPCINDFPMKTSIQFGDFPASYV